MEGKIDIKRTGLGMFFHQDWKIPFVKLIESGQFTEKNPLRSRDAWINITKILAEDEKKISRASVIFFLQDLEEMGWLASRKQSGRGGYHDVYWKKFPLSEFLNMLAQDLDAEIRSLSGELG